MSNTVVARALLRQGLARSQTGRTSYDVALGSARPICQRCERPLLAPAAARSPLHLSLSTRAFHASPTAYKKKKEDSQKPARGKSAEKPAKGSSTSTGTSTDADDGPKHPQPSPDEPLDFADVESRLQKHAEHFKASLRQMQMGARFDPDAVGALRVAVSKKDKAEKEAYPLRELAQVVPRGGRAVSLLVHEAEYVKPIMSAVQASPDFNQQPQRDPDNELELVLKVEPESRDDLVRRAKAVAHEWRDRIRAVRQKRDKLHATWKKDGTLGPDLKRTADKELEKVIKAATAEVDGAEKNAVKAAESK
ncbi:ribosome recycling factor [Xylaria castorea]|nr:ribosome recycling factor [Xylaria castorea]